MPGANARNSDLAVRDIDPGWAVSPDRYRGVKTTRGTWLLPAAALVTLTLSVLLDWAIDSRTPQYLAMAGLIVTAAPILWRTAREARRGNFATDAVAALAIGTALALRQPIPGLIIVLMQSGGEALERRAQRRASRALQELEAGAPRIAHQRSGEGYVDVPVADVRVGDVLLVRPGEVVPVDGTVTEGESHVDTAAITGEPVPIAARPGVRVFSGFWNGNAPLVLEATSRAAESQYERIVQLVREAQDRKAPIQRMADRYAVWFTPFTVLVAVFVYLATRDASRVLAVLVVATPCPLILATPVAIIGGMNRAARASIIFRSGAAIEHLATARAAVFDKTGTLTTGRPSASRLINLNGMPDADLLRWAAAVELGSGHVLAREIVDYANQRGVRATLADAIREDPGRGVHGQVEGRSIAIGSAEFIAQTIDGLATTLPATDRASLRSYIAVDGRLAAYIEFEDALRPDLKRMLARLREIGFRRIVILSGDDLATVRSVANSIGIDEAHGDLDPAQKLIQVQQIQKTDGPVLMIGDGTNDAPALAAADVGLAITPRGGGIAAETADVVLLSEDLTRVADAVEIARRTLRIARQSIGVGLGLSICGMAAAALGLLLPVPGALYQEAIDVAVILNALRTARA